MTMVGKTDNTPSKVARSQTLMAMANAQGCLVGKIHGMGPWTLSSPTRTSSAIGNPTTTTARRTASSHSIKPSSATEPLQRHRRTHRRTCRRTHRRTCRRAHQRGLHTIVCRGVQRTAVIGPRSVAGMYATIAVTAVRSIASSGVTITMIIHGRRNVDGLTRAADVSRAHISRRRRRTRRRARRRPHRRTRRRARRRPHRRAHRQTRQH